MCDSAGRLAPLLAGLNSLKNLRYPGLAGDPSHEIARRQMAGFGFLIGFELADAAAAEAFLTDCPYIVQAPSFGSTHTSGERRIRWGDKVADGFIRLSVGLEPVEPLWAAINKALGSGTAQALDGRRIALRAPEESDARVSFLAKVDNLDVKPEAGLAKVVVNPRTGSVVMNQKVTLDACAVAHGSLSVVVASPEAGGDVQVKQDNGSLMNVKAGANLADVVKALNSLGANPLDLLAILQALKAAGSLRADLEII